MSTPKPLLIDIPKLAQAQARAQGQVPLQDLPRVLAESAAAESAAADSGTDAVVNWQLEGATLAKTGGASEVWAELSVSAHLPMLCQRCLQPMGDHAVELSRRYRFVATEEQAEELDEVADDHDVLVSSRQFDLAELLEDEILLDLPTNLSHEVCPNAPKLTTGEAEAPKPKPFAALAGLKGKL
jgi:uncharacterized protein